eukprot:1042613_1
MNVAEVNTVFTLKSTKRHIHVQMNGAPNRQLQKQSVIITTAINALKRDIPSLDDEACCRFIIDLVKQDEKKLASVSGSDIDKETEDILATFEESEMKEYAQALQSHDDIGVMDWDKIIECVWHEMWPKLGSIMKGILRLNKKE